MPISSVSSLEVQYTLIKKVGYILVSFWFSFLSFLTLNRFRLDLEGGGKDSPTRQEGRKKKGEMLSMVEIEKESY